MITETEARKQLRDIQQQHGDTFTPEFTQKLGRVWEQGVVITNSKAGGDFTRLMSTINRKVNEFVYGTQSSY